MRQQFTACIALACIALSGLANAQKVYKCTVNGIVTFSQQECGKDSKQIADIPKSRAPAAQDDAIGGATHGQQKNYDDANLRAISNSVADAQCERDARKLYIEPDTSEIDALQAQIKRLESSQYMSNTRNGMTYTAQSQLIEQADRTRAASLRSVVATKQAQNEAIRTESRKAMQEALVRCDQQRAQRETAK